MKFRPSSNLVSYGIGLLLLCIAVFALFNEPILGPYTLSSPDTPVTHVKNDAENFPANSAGAWLPYNLGLVTPPINLLPRRFLELILSPSDYLLWGYITDIFLLFVATLVLLRAFEITAPVASVCSLAMALSCHTTSLISAGHMSKNGMMPFAVFTIAFLHLAITRVSALWLCLAGLCAGVALSEHYDVAYFFCILAAVYGLFLIFKNRTKFRSKRNRIKMVTALALGGLVTLATFYPSISYITKRFAPGRDEMVKIAHSIDRDAQWVFATNWSLPPEELVELLSPGLFGNETGSANRPYWGRTGQDISYPKTHVGLRNLRQHGVYLGVLQLILAAFAVAVIVRHKFLSRCDDLSAVPLSTVQKQIVLFWAVATPLLLLFAMGRYGPIYRLFYNLLPYAKNIRCPIKFLHTVELGVTILFAFGLEIVYQRLSELNFKKRIEVPRALFVVPLLLAALAIVSIGVVVVRLPELIEYWGRMGFEAETHLLSLGLISAMARTAVLLVICGALLLSTRTRLAMKPGASFLFVWLVACIIAVDLVAANRPYIKTNRLSQFLYSDNSLLDRIRKDGHGTRIIAPIPDQLSSQLAEMFRYSGVEYMEVLRGSDLDSDLKEFYAALESNPIRLWQITSTGLVFGPSKQLLPLLRRPDFSFVAAYRAASDPLKTIALLETPPNQSDYALLKLSGALPRAAVYHGVKVMPRADVLEELSLPAWKPEDYALVEEDSGMPFPLSGTGYTEVAIAQYSANYVKLSAETQTPGILVITDRYDPLWTALVDGSPSKIHRVNGLMRGIFLGQGKHDVELTFTRPYRQENILRLCGFAGVILLLSGVALRRSIVHRETSI